LESVILHSGSAGLIWWKLHNSNLKSSTNLDPLHDAFRMYAARAAVHEHHLKVMLPYFRKARMEPILAKGWAISRLYPHPGLRPYGDFDICVPPERMAEAQHLLDDESTGGIQIDYHARFRELDADYAVLFERSVRVAVGRSYVHVLCPEDHLRLLSIHMLYHGGWKAPWLCDVALMMETVSPDFDWKQFLAGDRDSEWVLAALALAQDLLGARPPEIIRNYLDRRNFPRWLFDALLEQWGRDDHYMSGPPASELVREGHFLEAFRSRWPNRLQATIRMGARVNRVPRLPFQLADMVKRAGKARRHDGHEDI
jgi:hypothetical protein